MGKGITTSRLPLDELPSALSEILTDAVRANFDDRQAAIQAGAEAPPQYPKGASSGRA